MANHTPGPWLTDGAGWIEGPNGEPVCEYAGCGTHDANWLSPADFQLALAAPELLVALEEMVRWHAKREPASMTVSGGEGLLPIEQQDEEVQQAMRAIAKATSP